MTLGTELTTFITGLNAEAAIDPTLLTVLVQNAQTILEEERPWVVLRKTDTSKSVATSSTWQTAIDLSTITDFSRFYSDTPFTLYDSSTNTRHYYRLVPFDRRLEYKDHGSTACYDENSKNLYLNGVPPFSGTLYINYVSTSTPVDPTSGSAVWTLFPSRFLPLLGYYAVGIFKGAVDYDEINKLMLPMNQAVLTSLKNAMLNWDNEKQLAYIDHNDPTEMYSYPRSGAVNRYDV